MSMKWKVVVAAVAGGVWALLEREGKIVEGWLVAGGTLLAILVITALEAWNETRAEEEAKEERAEERRERLANEREMKRMEMENQQVIELRKAEIQSSNRGEP